MKYEEPTQPTDNQGVFKGRLNRVGYLLAHVYLTLLFMALISVGLIISFAGGGRGVSNIVVYVVGIVAIVYIVAYYVVSVGLLIRRLHDVGQSGLLALLLLVPVVNSVLLLVMLFVPGTAGANLYGAGPQKTLGFRDVSGL